MTDRGDVLARLSGERDGQPLGAAADGAGQVDLRGGRRAPPGRMNWVERLELGLEPVDRRFEALDVARRDRAWNGPSGDGSASAEPRTNSSSWSRATRRVGVGVEALGPGHAQRRR